MFIVFFFFALNEEEFEVKADPKWDTKGGSEKVIKFCKKVPTNYKYISNMTLIISSTLSLRKVY